MQILRSTGVLFGVVCYPESQDSAGGSRVPVVGFCGFGLQGLQGSEILRL